ncbi:STAS/SEC14 domain-containing protein [Chondromyces crocatus]|uniref:STAS/SEC14 domain-containing protein n=1 Tax=Chondromyces crocatus TaxID=52 RepID=A0A0K1EBU8_CHOCO|nr:STAS/SEC14 domain-containing protein [Chondromyces crocatus]AKT38361.1 uncharacterized protein CMC5_025070 [Chondromyces crocatus]
MVSRRTTPPGEPGAERARGDRPSTPGLTYADRVTRPSEPGAERAPRERPSAPGLTYADRVTRPSEPGAERARGDRPSTSGLTYYGRHLLHHEPPDLYVVRLEGMLSPDEIRAMIADSRDFVAQAKYMLLLLDLRTHWAAPAETRKLVASIERRKAPRFMACLGGSFASRVMVSVGVRASNLFSPGGMMAAFFEDEGPARAWLYTQRRRMTGQGDAPP